MGDDQLIGVYINNLIFFESDFLFCDPSIDCYMIDKTNSSCIKADNSSSNTYLYTSKFGLSAQEIQRKDGPRIWDRLLVIRSNFSELNSESKILMFEICKNKEMKESKETEKVRIAWAFLIPFASDGSTNTNKNLKLQLYKIRKDCKTSHQDCNIYHLYTEHKHKKVFGSLQLSVKSVLQTNVKPLEIKVPSEPKKESVLEHKLANDFSAILKPILKTSWEWSRLPSQTCKVPNQIHKIHSLNKNDVSCLQFSRNGLQVAISALSQIFIYDVISGEEVITLNGHVGFIYELDWSFDDQHLLSVSNDCRGAIWSLTQKTPLFVLPHPSYVYCGRWFGNDGQIVTGGKDHLIRFWYKNGDSFDLVEEITGHSGFVSALTAQDSSVIFSGDSHGFVMIRKFSEGKWMLLKEFSLSETKRHAVDSIHIHSSRRRIIVSIRSRGSYLIDVMSGIILQSYNSGVNTIARSISSLTPCGSYLFSFYQNGDVGVWEVNTGKLFATYDNLFSMDRLSEFSGYIHYHPFEHMMGITALGQNYPLLILKYEASPKNDTKKLGLTFKCPDKKTESDFSASILPSKWSTKLLSNKV